MADQDPINPNDGQGPGDGSENPPQVAAIAQYIKDLSVECPNSPQVFQWQVQPQLDVQFSIQSERVGDDAHEVALRIAVSAKSDNGAHFLIDLTYAGLFAVRNFPDEALPPFILVEAPHLLFPFARQIVAEAVQNTGFPPLLLEPIDFGRAFVEQMKNAQNVVTGEDAGAAPTAAPDDTAQA